MSGEAVKGDELREVAETGSLLELEVADQGEAVARAVLERVSEHGEDRNVERRELLREGLDTLPETSDPQLDLVEVALMFRRFALDHPVRATRRGCFHALCEGLASAELRGLPPGVGFERLWRDGIYALVVGLAAGAGP